MLLNCVASCPPQPERWQLESDSVHGHDDVMCVMYFLWVDMRKVRVAHRCAFTSSCVLQLVFLTMCRPTYLHPDGITP